MKKSKLFLGVILSSFFVYSCGGGGGSDSSSSGSTQERISISTASTEDVEKAISAVSALENSISSFDQAVGGAEYIQENLNNNLTSLSAKDPSKGIIANYVLSRLKSKLKGQIRTQASNSETNSCENGGTVTVNVSWTNPDCQQLGFEDACYQNNIIEANIIANNCDDGYIKLNGNIYAKLVYGNDADSYYSLSTFEMKLNNVKADVKNDLLNIPYDYEFPYMKITYKYSQNEYEVGIDGSFLAIAQDNLNKDYKLEFSNLYIKSLHLQTDEYMDVLESEVTVKGGVQIYEGSTKVLDIKTRDLKIYDNYTVNPEISRINGYIYEGVCSQKWFEIKTIEDIKTPEYSDCPIDGKITVNGNVSIEATSNGGLIISDGNETRTYDSCKDFGSSNACNL